MKAFAALLKKYRIRLAVAAAAALLALLPGQLARTGFAERYVAGGPVGRVIKPAQTFLFGSLPFSAAELLLAAAAIGLALYVALAAVSAVRSEKRGETLFGAAALLLAVCAVLWCAFSFLWSAYYYRPSFADRRGIELRPLSADDLYNMTLIAAAQLNALSGEVPRNADGVFDCGYDEAIAGVKAAFDRAGETDGEFAGLSAAKKVVMSRLMSRLNLTGFYFPYTNESNVNADVPPLLFASTVAHEMSHQAGVAREDEANFIGWAICAGSGNAQIEYSGWALGFIHLLNALYAADPQLCEQAAGGLYPAVWADIADNGAYWRRFEGRAAEAATAVNDGYLKSHSQEQGVRSYGRMIDLMAAVLLDGGGQ